MVKIDVSSLGHGNQVTMKEETMSEHLVTTTQKPIQNVRDSYIAKTLTESQRDLAVDVASIINRHIQKTGSFREALTDYAHAFARSEKFDAMKGEVIIRDVYTAQYGRTMNAAREALLENEKNLPERAHEQALQAARKTLDTIAQGETEPFYRAYDREGSMLARTLNITESGAKQLMVENYRAIEGRELYETGKELEERHHKPKVAEARKEREKTRSQVVVQRS
jgi:hypothetical protein